MHKELVNLPKNTTLDEIVDDPKRYPFFADCIRALDSTHLPIAIKGGYKQQAPWRGGKGILTQNVLAAVNFNINFVYVLARWEGTAHNCKVINSAKKKGFKAPQGRYYLANAGYSNTSITLVPYRGVQYHLCKQAQANMRPQNAKELFNLRHAGLRNVIERTFGIFKRRFRYFKAARQNFPLATQILLVYTLTAVHNFLNMHNQDDLEDYGVVEDEEDAQMAEEESEVAMNQRRDEIAELMWRGYCQAIGRPL